MGGGGAPSGGIIRVDDVRNLRPEGKPNSRVDFYKNGKLFQQRWYGPNGKAIRNRDHTDHGNLKEHPYVPHDHPWDWSKDSPRQDDLAPDWNWS